MPPLRSARKLQPHIVLDDIFKNKSTFANRKNVVTSLGPPWSRRFSAESNEKSFNTHQRTINLRSRGSPEVIVIEDETNIPKQPKSVKTKDSDAARTRGLPDGIRRKLAAAFECPIKSENCSEPDLMIIDDKTEISKVLMQCEPMETIDGVATLGGLTPKSNKKLANNSRRTVDLENRSTPTVNAHNDKSIVPKTPIESTPAGRQVAVASKKRGRPLGKKNKKVLVTSERIFDKANCSCIDVIILTDDKTEIPKFQCEAEQSTVASAPKSRRGRPSKNDLESFVVAMLKRKGDILEANGELVSERDPVWQRIRHELEYQVTAQTLRRIAKSSCVYKMLRSQNEKVEAVIPTVNTAEVRETAEVDEIAVIDDPKRDEYTARFERALEILSTSLDCLSNAIEELRKEFQQWNKSAQNGK